MGAHKKRKRNCTRKEKKEEDMSKASKRQGGKREGFRKGKKKDERELDKYLVALDKEVAKTYGPKKH